MRGYQAHESFWADLKMCLASPFLTQKKLLYLELVG